MAGGATINPEQKMRPRHKSNGASKYVIPNPPSEKDYYG
jgi:hypothetical protein